MGITKQGQPETRCKFGSRYLRQDGVRETNRRGRTRARQGGPTFVAVGHDILPTCRGLTYLSSRSSGRDMPRTVAKLKRINWKTIIHKQDAEEDCNLVACVDIG